MGIQCENRKFFIFGLTRMKKMYFFGLKVQNAICDGTSTHLDTKPGSYKSRSVLRSKIVKQNCIILINYGCGGPHAHVHAHMHTHTQRERERERNEHFQKNV